MINVKADTIRKFYAGFMFENPAFRAAGFAVISGTTHVQGCANSVLTYVQNSVC
jgi:hypothetical protein